MIQTKRADELVRSSGSKIIRFEFETHCPLYVVVKSLGEFKDDRELLEFVWYLIKPYISWEEDLFSNEMILDRLPKDAKAEFTHII